MSQQLYISQITHRLMTGDGGRFLVGDTISGSGQSPQGELYLNNSSKSIRWIDVYGYRRSAKGWDIGSTGEPHGSVWVTSSGELRFALSGRMYTPWRNRFVNSTNAGLWVYSNAGRTSLLFSLGKAQSYNYGGHLTPYFCRLKADNGDTSDFAVNPAAGYTTTLSGTHSPGGGGGYQCGHPATGSISYGKSCYGSGGGMCANGGTGCSGGGTTRVDCQSIDPNEYNGNTYRIVTYSCIEYGYTPGGSGAWNISTSYSS